MTNILRPKKLDELGIKNEIPKTSKLINDILKISLPAAAETFLVGLVGLMDTIMVGSLGKEAISSVSITQQPVYITLTFCFGLTAGIIAIVSRRFGQNDREGANKALRQTLVLGIIISSIITFLSLVFGRAFIKLAGAKPDTIDNATAYFKIVSSVLILNYLRILILAGQRAAGYTKMTLITNIIANATNILFNYLLINGNFGFPRLEVRGAAYATIIGNIVAFLVAFASVYRSKRFVSIHFKENWRLDIETIKSLYFVSLSAFIEQIFVRIGFFLIAVIINNLGTDAVAINTITQNIVSLSFNIIDGFAIGAAALVGKSLGEDKADLSYAYGVLSQMICIGIGIFMMVIIMIFRKPLSDIFTNDKMIVSQAAKLLLFASIVVLPQSLQWVTTVMLRAAGDSKYTARGSMYSVMIIRPLLSYILCYPLSLGLYGAWAGMLIDQTFRLIHNEKRFLSLEWIKIRL